MLRLKMKVLKSTKGLANYFRSHLHKDGIIVCENPRFIYMKPGKTAGTSILRSGLEQRLPQIFHHKDHPERFDEWLDQITDDDLADYFIFSVVRNPWDRLVSISTYFDIPFYDFVKNIDKYRENKKIRMHALPLTLYTHLHGVPFVDFICRMECLQSDMNLVFDHLGLERERLPVVNQTKHEYYAHYYGDEEIKAVASLYKDDIQYYGYAFETNREYMRSAVPAVDYSLSQVIIHRVRRLLQLFKILPRSIKSRIS